MRERATTPTSTLRIVGVVAGFMLLFGSAIPWIRGDSSDAFEIPASALVSWHSHLGQPRLGYILFALGVLCIANAAVPIHRVMSLTLGIAAALVALLFALALAELEFRNITDVSYGAWVTLLAGLILVAAFANEIRQV
jgi:hypothetical protein